MYAHNHRSRYPLRSCLNKQQSSLGSPSSEMKMPAPLLSLDMPVVEQQPEEQEKENAPNNWALKSLLDNIKALDDESTFDDLSYAEHCVRYLLKSQQWAYGMLQFKPEQVLNHQEASVIPTYDEILGAYIEYQDQSLQFKAHLLLRSQADAFKRNHSVFSINDNVTYGGLLVDDSLAVVPKSSFQSTQVRWPNWFSTSQRALFLGEVGGALLKRDGQCAIPPATSDDETMIDEVTKNQEIASGGFKKIYDTGNGHVLLRYCGHDMRHLFHLDDLVVSLLCSGLSTLTPNFARLCSTPCSDSRDDCSYVTMQRFAVDLEDYLTEVDERFIGKGEEVTKILTGVAVQVGFAVLAGQSVLNLRFGDVKSSNVMLDGDCTHKFYLLSLGSAVYAFESNTEPGYGTVKIIDHSTTDVAPGTNTDGDDSDDDEDEFTDWAVHRPSFRSILTTPTLTPLDAYLLDFSVKGFHRDMHNIVLLIIEMFSNDGMRAMRNLAAPEGIELVLWDEFESKYPNFCYHQLVLLSTPDQCIVDLLSSDPTFAKNPKFKAFKDANAKLLESKAFKEDVAVFSLLQGTKFKELRQRLGDDKVLLLWKGVAPNPALRPTLPKFMLAFFKDSMTVLESPEEELRDWYEANVTEETEIIPLFLNESHVDILFGDEKESFLLKGDRSA